jgi:hypothetical protein
MLGVIKPKATTTNNNNNTTQIKQVLPHSPLTNDTFYLGNLHFDWSLIQGSPQKFQQKAELVTMLRHPVSRAVSHFYFAEQLAHAHRVKEAKKNNQKPPPPPSYTMSSPLSDFLFLNQQRNTTNPWFDNRDFWQDGQAAVSWLTGTHIANWVQVPAEQVPLREELTAPQYTPYMLHLAADRLEQTLWFGVLEDLPRSTELLEHALGRSLTRRLEFPVANKGKIQHPPVSFQERQALESLLPQDLWLYQYALNLFEARWTAYQNNSTDVVLPPRPPVPETLPCWSSRFLLNCTTGPLKGYYVYNPAPLPPSSPSSPPKPAPQRFPRNEHILVQHKKWKIVTLHNQTKLRKNLTAMIRREKTKIEAQLHREAQQMQQISTAQSQKEITSENLTESNRLKLAPDHNEPEVSQREQPTRLNHTSGN